MKTNQTNPITPTIYRKKKTIQFKKLKPSKKNHFKFNKQRLEDNYQKIKKKIIRFFEENKNQKLMTFKIMVRDANYIIGSDIVVCRGEVIAY